MRLVTVNDILYRIIVEVDPKKGYSPEQVKDQYFLADIIKERKVLRKLMIINF